MPLALNGLVIRMNERAGASPSQVIRLTTMTSQIERGRSRRLLLFLEVGSLSSLEVKLEI